MKKNVVIFGGALILIVALLVTGKVLAFREDMRNLERGLKNPRVEEALARSLMAVQPPDRHENK